MRHFLIPVVALCLVGGLAMAENATPLTTAETAFMESAFSGKLESIQRLLSEGVAVDTADPQNHTALMWASFNGHTKVVGHLLAQGAKVGHQDENGRSALMYASSGPYVETVKLLLKHGAKINEQGKLEGFTALMTAAAEGQMEVVRLLLTHGADSKIADEDGDTAISFARQKGHTAVVELLENPPPVKDAG
jgi:ankyrin repeat protein